MKNLLFLCTIWSSIYITLSDVITRTHDVGTINYAKWLEFMIHCTGDCKIDEVEATFDRGGKLYVMGYYGKGPLQFCKGLSSGETATTCVMSKNTGLSNAYVVIFAYTKTTYNVHLNVTGSNLLSITDHKTLKYSVGSISGGSTAYLLIYCKGDCYVGKVEATFRSGGNVAVIGEYGEHRMRFCKGSSPNDAATTCVISEKTGMSKVLISLLAQQTSYDVELAVTGGNLLSIQPPKIFATTIGTLEQNDHVLYDVKCGGKKRACDLIEVSATFKKEGDVDLHGYYDDNISFCDGEDRDTTGFQDCPIRLSNINGINDAQVIVRGYNRSENVVLKVTGYNLEGVTYHSKYP